MQPVHAQNESDADLATSQEPTERARPFPPILRTRAASDLCAIPHTASLCASGTPNVCFAILYKFQSDPAVCPWARITFRTGWLSWHLLGQCPGGRIPFRTTEGIAHLIRGHVNDTVIKPARTTRTVRVKLLSGIGTQIRISNEFTINAGSSGSTGFAVSTIEAFRCASPC
jgi:hypothetical protein